MQREILTNLHADSSRYLNVLLNLESGSVSEHDQRMCQLFSGLYHMQPELHNGKSCYKLRKKVPQMKDGKETPVETEIWLYWEKLSQKEKQYRVSSASTAISSTSAAADQSGPHFCLVSDVSCDA